jgi:phosphohistidine phosphatase
MTLRLILTRHAKSGWDDPDLDDFERPLTERGRRSAQAIGGWLWEKGYLPDLILCSAAWRTRETLALVLAQWPDKPEVSYRQALYHASARGILEVVAGVAAKTVMVVGHNPGIGTLACCSVAMRPDHPDFGRYPTGATAVLDFDAEDWRSARSATCADFIVPRDLLKDSEND